MVRYEFYRGTYRGDAAPEAEFPALARDAAAQLARYKRIYTVSAPAGQEESEQMAMCAMIDALYYFQTAGSAGASVSVGSVSSSVGQGAQPDCSAKAQAAELLRCARLYLDVYRGCGPCCG